MRLYNTLGRHLQDFVPLRTDKMVGLYTCGPTVYAEAHLGNLRSYIFEDVLKRVLLANGFTVKHVMNITDVGHLTNDEDEGEDKIEKARDEMLYVKCLKCHKDTPIYIACARGEPFNTLTLMNCATDCKYCGTEIVYNKIPDSHSDVFYLDNKSTAYKINIWELANHFTDIFKIDLEKLNISPPDEWIKATDYIPAQIALVQELEAKGFTYKTSDGVYFDTSKLPDYGVLEPQRLAGQRAGERVDMGEKKNPTDFAVWKLSAPLNRHPELVEGSTLKKRQMEWDSPWGTGFPGWHLECSAISQTAFAGFNLDDKGVWFDIHCGGIDHIAVHHTNEIAQTQAATGRMLAKYWLHGAFLVLGGEQRMGKSEGNSLTLRTLQDKLINPLAYRYFCLQTHYRSPLTFSWEAVEAAQSGWQSLRMKTSSLPDGAVDEVAYAKFLEAVNDDLNTAKALAVLQDYLSGSANKNTVAKMDEVLGLNLLDYKIAAAPAEVVALANQREVVRQAKDFSKADELRQQIEATGWVVDDTANGFKLRPR